MDLRDEKLYMCTLCLKRCLWKDLSKRELRCPRCSLPPKSCAICDKMFEPREKSNSYCKRCDFYILRHAAVKPPPIPTQDCSVNVKQNRNGSSITDRWKEIKAASGIVDDFCTSD
ncbi:uncharacterized protein LOC108143670 [Drosophila elegans]|uniref:uncharacterized protein LOC108143670 n=1 Tax=Drosophila elegans TaxID=30023 RepID=UPI0007E87902|nr:uncharacterized protein LOC108143670 [Drosophila elegans]